jgi:uncharacterized protein (TIGR02453 family)
MGGAFRGFGPNVFEWFEGLERDNSKAYFTATRDVYEEDVRGGVEAMLEELGETFAGEVRVFRQQRDLRFSPDKRPYKDRTYGVVGRYYAQLSARGLYAGTGYHVMARDQLERFRAAADPEGTGEELRAAVAAAEAAGLDVEGAALQTAPRGYPRDHPRIELLRRKSIVAGWRLPPGGGISRSAALDHCAGAWRAAGPINAWLDANVGPSELPAEGRYGRRR